MSMIMNRRLWYKLIPICCIIVLFFGFSSFIDKKSLAGYTLWQGYTIDSEFQGAEHIYAVDVDKDGDMDILGAASVDDDIVWYDNDGSQSFTKTTIDDNFDGANYVYATDLDGDGDIDVLGSAGEADDIAWWENNGSQVFTKTVIDGDFDGANCVYAANIEDKSDNHLDILAVAANANSIAWYHNDGAENFTKTVIDANFGGAAHACADDINQDGHMDIVGAAFTDNEVAWYENDGNENFTKYIIDEYLNGANYVYTADVRGTGYTDILASGAGEGENGYISWYENNGSEYFSERLIDQYFDGASSIHADDVDGDGDTDILGTATDDGDIAWYEKVGSYEFDKHIIDDGFWAADGASTGAHHVYTADIEIVSHDRFIDVVACAFGSSNGKVSWFQYPLGPVDDWCFIATAAYGTPMAAEIDVLRDFRDQYLLTNPVGEAFVDIYYKTSPPIAEFIADHSVLKQVVRTGLEPFIAVGTVAINTTLAQKIAIVSSVFLLSALLIVWSKRRSLAI